ncbi:MAG: sulfite exporter TauE/SafE family protein [Spirochaetia bacterium]|nr:sulfite exporter TauE/SafE family protein [Spirochaetia bacterium]
MTFLIILFASIIQATTGFGFSLVAVPLLSIFLPLKDFIPMLVLFSFLLSFFLFKNLAGNYNKKRIIILAFSGLSSTIFGIFMLKFIDDNILKFAVGCIILISSVLMLFGIRVKVKVRILGDIIAGAVSGFLNGSVSLSGPPVILLLSNEGAEKETFRKTLTTYFLLLNFISLPIFFFNGLLTRDIVLKSLINLPALGIGMFLGLIIGNRISEGHFKKITLGMILVLGIMSIMSAIL